MSTNTDHHLHRELVMLLSLHIACLDRPCKMHQTNPPCCTHLDVAIENASCACRACNAFVKLLCNPPGVVQLQLAVQVLQLPSTGQEEVLHGSSGVRPILNNPKVVPGQATPNTDLHQLIHTAFGLCLQDTGHSTQQPTVKQCSGPSMQGFKLAQPQDAGWLLAGAMQVQGLTG